jgi:hypothetical protein
MTKGRGTSSSSEISILGRVPFSTVLLRRWTLYLFLRQAYIISPGIKMLIIEIKTYTTMGTKIDSSKEVWGRSEEFIYDFEKYK